MALEDILGKLTDQLSRIADQLERISLPVVVSADVTSVVPEGSVSADVTSVVPEGSVSDVEVVETITEVKTVTEVEAITEVETATEASSVTYTWDDLRSAATAYIMAHSKDEAIALVKQLTGKSQLKDVAEADYGKIIDAMKV